MVKTVFHVSFLLALLGASVLVTGCGVSPTGSTELMPVAMKGAVHGGLQPIAGAHVYLFAANTTGYGGSGIAASSSNASVSLLNASSTGHGDSLGGYVLSGGDGSFSITGDYTCPAGAQVYLYALGGDAGAGVNPAAGLMAGLGSCSSLSSSTFIAINEVSTVGAAFSMAGFATDATHVSSSGTALAQTGIANAFASAANLVMLASGAALATTPAGNGTVPQAEINTLADILAACVNSDGTVMGPTSPTACYTLFSNALPGGSSGTMPTDTASAAINIAHNPANQVSALYSLASAAALFQPTLGVAPNDWTMGLRFTGGGLSNPVSLAIDGAGDVWIANNGEAPNTSSVTELSSTGAVLSGSSGYTGGGMSFAISIAIDPSGNAWVAGYGNSNVVKLSSSGTIQSGANGFKGGGLNFPLSIAIDGSGNAWVADEDAGAVIKLGSDGTILSGTAGFMAGGVASPYSIAIDQGGNAWVTDLGARSLAELNNSGAVQSGTGYLLGNFGPRSVGFDSTGNVWMSDGIAALKLTSGGTYLSPSTGYPECVSSGIGLMQTTCQIYGGPLAIDGMGSAWVEIAYTVPDPVHHIGIPYWGVTRMDNTGHILSGATGYQGGGIEPNYGLSVDGSGNVWALSGGTGVVMELIGAGTPVVTPLSAGVKNGTLGTEP